MKKGLHASWLLILFALLVSCQQASSESQENLESLAISWKATNPGGGGAFNSPVITSEGYWAVASDLGGIYVSKNLGVSWYAIGSRNGLNVTHVSSMAAHPAGKLLIGTDSGLYTALSDGSSAHRTYGSGYIAALAVSADPNIVYAAVHPEYNARSPFIIRSIDAGETWATTGSNLPANLRITGMRVHPVDANAVWVIADEGRFNLDIDPPPAFPKSAYFSTNGGQAFIRLDPNFGDLIDIAYAQDPNNLNLMYATTLNGNIGAVFKSLETGFNWLDITPTTNKPSGIILADATNTNHVRIIDLDQHVDKNSYLWESTNAGTSWSKRLLSVAGGWSGADETWGLGYSFQGLGQTIGYNPGTPNTVLWVNSQFVYKSSNGGKNWLDAVTKGVNGHWRSRGIDNVVPILVEPSQADANLVYAGYMDMGLWRSDDGGASWIDLNTTTYSHGWLGNGGNTLSVIADPARPDVVWAQVAGNLENCASPCEEPLHLLKSTNRGTTWTELSTGLPSPIKRLEGLSLAANSSSTARRLFVVANGDVYRSQNDGTSWQRVHNCPNNDCIKTVYTTGNTVYALSPSGIWRSVQAGASGSWLPLSLPSTMNSSWTPSQHWLHDLWTYTGPMDLAARGSELWVAVKGVGKGLYYSGDSGQTWTRVRADSYARSVEIDPVTNEVYFGSSSAISQGGFQASSNGVFASANGTTNWVARNQGLAFKFATSISIAPNGTRWITSPGQGLMKWQ
jgi:hypothetical protein